jgi:hypothetical protein
VRRSLDAVGGDASVLRLTMLEVLTHHVREVLMKRPAAGDVQDLHPAADPEDRQVSAIGRPDERQLDGIRAWLGGSELGMWLLAVDARLQVRPAGEAHAIDTVEQGRDRVGAQQRHDHRDAAGALDGLGIQRGERDLELRRLALGPGDDVLGASEL